MSASSIAFKPEDLKEAVKEFRGVIVRAEYGMNPLGMEGSPAIEKKRAQLAIQIETPEYEKPQYEWYPPSNVKMTKPVCELPDASVMLGGSEGYVIPEAGKVSLLRLARMGFPAGVRWAYFLEAMVKVGAMKDIELKGTTDEERLNSFADSLVGMEFNFKQYDLEIVVKDKETGKPRKIECLLPTEYFGKKEVGPISEIRTEEITLG